MTTTGRIPLSVTWYRVPPEAAPSFRQDAGTQCHGRYLSASTVPQEATSQALPPRPRPAGRLGSRSPSFRQDAGTQCHGRYLSASPVPQEASQGCRRGSRSPSFRWDGGTQCQPGPSRKRGRCAGCGLPSLALGPGLRAGTTRIAVNRSVRHSGRMPESSAMDGNPQRVRTRKISQNARQVRRFA